MMETNEYESPKAVRMPLRYRIRYMFSNYKMRNFFNTVGKKVPVYLLVILLVLSFCYISLHPVNKVKVNYFLTRNCTLKITAKQTALSNNFVLGGNIVIRIDGDWIEVRDGRDTDYYHLDDDGKIYHYTQNIYGEWIKMIYNSNPEDEKIGSELLDKHNYQRSKVNFFVWRLDGEIDDKIKGMSNIRVQRVEGSIAIVGEFFVEGIKCEESIRFTKFGRTEIEAPWDKLENATFYDPSQSN